MSAARCLDGTDADHGAIESIVARLRDLHEGPKALPEVISLGDRAVPALEALLRAPAESIPHRRWLAADALARIGSRPATLALIRSLSDCTSRNLDSVALEAESLVVNRIAEGLDRNTDPEVTNALLEALTRGPYANCARALGKRRELRAIPLLVSCLYEDTVRSAAMEALRHLGGAVATPLISALAEEPSRGEAEAPRHVDARAAAATLLGTVNGSEVERALVQALTDEQPTVRLAAALALAGHRGAAAQQAASVLMTALGLTDWPQAEAIVHGLLRLGAQAERAVMAAIVQEPRSAADRVRRARAVGIAMRLSFERSIPVLARLYSAADPNIRLAALGALGHQGSVDCSLLIGFLSDPITVIRRKAVEMLCAFNGLRPSDAVALLGDTDPAIRMLIRRRLRCLGARARPSVHSAIVSLGAPLHGWARVRLWFGALGFWIISELSAVARWLAPVSPSRG